MNQMYLAFRSIFSHEVWNLFSLPESISLALLWKGEIKRLQKSVEMYC